MPPASRQPYVGASAFAHKAGLHASAIKVDPDLYQHMDPVGVGNDMRLLVSDMAGPRVDRAEGPRAGLRPVRRPRAGHAGSPTGQGDGAARLHLRGRGRVLRAAADRGGRGPAAVVLRRRVLARDHRLAARRGEAVSEATVKLRAAGVRYVATGEGNGPVNALDHALRAAIGQAYPEVAKFELIDYKVRILDPGHGTDAITRVLIETTRRRVVVGHRRRRRPTSSRRPGARWSTASRSACGSTRPERGIPG